MMPGRILITGMWFLAFAAAAADTFETFLATNPEAEATRAFDAGDHRHIVVPVCLAQRSEVLPGWPLSGPTPPGLWIALEKGQRPFQCADLGEGLGSPRFTRLIKYAEQYNRRLLELEQQNNN